MTDKQIIIDDYFTEVTDGGGGTIDYTIIPYKTYQLIKAIWEQNKYIPKKEQECEALKAELNRANCQIADDEILQCDMRETIEELKAELEQEQALKETYFACYRAKHEELANEYEALKVRCKSFEEISGRLQEQNHELTVENELLEVYRSITPLNVKKLVQTLTEIKEIVKYQIPKVNYAFAKSMHPEKFACYEQILQKISEVLDEEV